MVVSDFRYRVNNWYEFYYSNFKNDTDDRHRKLNKYKSKLK